jgi:uncharacterized cupredoxin-like copper-binding protein
VTESVQRARVVALFLAMLGGACGGTSPQRGQPDDEVTPTPVLETSVSVRLVDFAVEPRPHSVPAGQITFAARNDGYAKDEEGDPVASVSGGVHELSVLRTDYPAADLPQNTTEFLVDTEAPGIEILGSTPPLSEGAHESLTVDLDSGLYVLICNLTSHYARGMWAELSVE